MTYPHSHSAAELTSADGIPHYRAVAQCSHECWKTGAVARRPLPSTAGSRVLVYARGHLNFDCFRPCCTFGAHLRGPRTFHCQALYASATSGSTFTHEETSLAQFAPSPMRE
jgi:hypothetical protein